MSELKLLPLPILMKHALRPMNYLKFIADNKRFIFLNKTDIQIWGVTKLLKSKLSPPGNSNGRRDIDLGGNSWREFKS